MKTWLITGTSKGFGRIWAEAALERGDKVAATARDKNTLQPLKEKYGDNVLTLALDVNDRQADFEVVKKVRETFGRIDVVVNNAGYGLFGFVEEVSEQEARAQIETNVFGALWMTQAVLPIMRQQKSGHIIQVSSVGGVTAFPGLGLYHASKWALEGFSQSLRQEVSDLGIHVTLVEPGGYATDWAADSSVKSTPIEAYQPIRDARTKARAQSTPGNPMATADGMLDLVDMQDPPLRLMFGKGINELMHAEYQKRLDEWDRYKDMSEKAQG